MHFRSTDLVLSLSDMNVFGVCSNCRKGESGGNHYNKSEDGRGLHFENVCYYLECEDCNKSKTENCKQKVRRIAESHVE